MNRTVVVERSNALVYLMTSVLELKVEGSNPGAAISFLWEIGSGRTRAAEKKSRINWLIWNLATSQPRPSDGKSNMKLTHDRLREIDSSNLGRKAPFSKMNKWIIRSFSGWKRRLKLHAPQVEYIIRWRRLFKASISGGRKRNNKKNYSL